MNKDKPAAPKPINEATEEESPGKIDDYHRGSDNSIKNVVRSLKEELGLQGVALSGVDDKDTAEDTPATDTGNTTGSNSELSKPDETQQKPRVPR